MGSGLGKFWTGFGGTLVLACVAAVCCGDENCSTSDAGCCQSEQGCSASESACSTCTCPAGECPDCCAEQGCQSNCCDKTAAQTTPTVVVLDVDLVAPAAPVTLSSLAGGKLPSDWIAELATTPTGLAGCCQGKCSEGTCAGGQPAVTTTGTVTAQVWAIRGLLQNVPHCTVVLDPATFSLLPGDASAAAETNTNIVLAKFNETEQSSQPCSCCQLRTAARQKAAEQLGQIAASLESVALTHEAARARQLAEELSSPSENAEVEVGQEVAQPAQNQVLR